MIDILLYIVLIMIFYDFSLHLLRLALGLEKARKIKYYWPIFLSGEKNRKRYEVFWTIYWLTALLLVALYLLLI